MDIQHPRRPRQGSFAGIQSRPNSQQASVGLAANISMPLASQLPSYLKQNDSSYDLTGIRHAIVYLNSGDIDAISGIAGVDRRLAQKIIDAWRDRMGRPERIRFPSYDGLANYEFTDGRTFTPIQKTIINTMPDYVRLYQN